MHLRKQIKLAYLKYLIWRAGANNPILDNPIQLMVSRNRSAVYLIERRALPLPLWTHVVIISTFPFAFSLMLMSTPVMISGVVAATPLAGIIGLSGLLAARMRGIRAEDRFLSLMLIAFGLSVFTLAPLLVAGVRSNATNPLLAASFLYGITLVIYLMLVIGLYGLVLNIKKPEYHMVGA